MNFNYFDKCMKGYKNYDSFTLKDKKELYRRVKRRLQKNTKVETK